MLLISVDVTPRNPVTRRRPLCRQLSHYDVGRRRHLALILQLVRQGTQWRRRLVAGSYNPGWRQALRLNVT